MDIKDHSLAKTIYWAVIKAARSNTIMRKLVDTTAFVYYILFRSHKIFTFRKKSYKYFYHLYNRTVASERVVEIPIAKSLINEYQGKDILEIGNVLAHYFPISHDVLDKYEKGEGVINKDVVNVVLPKKYDLILSVSTMEHVGYSYGEKKEKDKFKNSIANLKKFLKPNGIIFVTFPVYYNEFITELILKNKMPFTNEYFMKRTSFMNEWQETSRKDAMKIRPYDSHYANANILYLGYFRKN